ncbi:MAG TPA: primosomal protein N', partial [Bacteroidota bacterium]|nr:primosomal protein N' [Bacteroidota bacterium]
MKIDERADNAVLPIIEIVDMRKKDKTKSSSSYISNKLIEKIKDRIEKNEGVILFHNRRGFAPQLYCRDCGYVPMCKNCDISLTYHKANDSVVCHYCGYSEPSPKTCPVCGSSDLHTIGAGTERIEEEMVEILKAKGVVANIQRFDRD